MFAGLRRFQADETTTRDKTKKGAAIGAAAGAVRAR